MDDGDTVLDLQTSVSYPHFAKVHDVTHKRLIKIVVWWEKIVLNDDISKRFESITHKYYTLTIYAASKIKDRTT